MELRDMKPLEDGVPIYAPLYTTSPDDIEPAPWWMTLGVIAVDLLLWAIIIFIGLRVSSLIAELL